ncbi:helix-turn-helix domain-containing protein [Amycolatopsis acidicola]|uniref:Helix-turn-helix domain-containing protein n=1 Tax=Amycolatopsis acidicola TaxID=2596893 RepID=A0A5N0VL83_9PSEU|nr:IclR family transcriptional regulator C-terminal domain-containing protein [Amycolatopsis acidicola]KAA9165492.1 helix-turn-helix domain-containing protein [Amycolatopsis acidicola]
MDLGDEGTGEADFVQALARGLEVIRAFDAARPAQSLSDVARVTGLSRAAVRRSLLTFQKLGYVRSEGTLFQLTPKVLELGHAYLRGLSTPQIAEPHLKDLMLDVQETTALSVLDGDDVVHIARIPTTGVITVSINVGSRFPAYATAMGRVLLAGLDEQVFTEYLARVSFEAFTDRTVRDADQLRQIVKSVADNGFCLADQELNRGLRAVAVPVRDRTGAVIAAANIAVSAGLRSLEELRAMVPRLRECAAAIEKDLHLVDGP